MASGSQFERDICRQLSSWWTYGERDDVFWRTSMSGGRATIRRKTSRKTAFQYGDVTATDPIGIPLIERCIIELKRGYASDGPGELLDKKEHLAPQTWEKWISKTIYECRYAGVPWWMLISRRSRREALITFPTELENGLTNGLGIQGSPRMQLHFSLQHCNDYWTPINITTTLLDNFIAVIDPERIKQLKIPKRLKGVKGSR